MIRRLFCTLSIPFIHLMVPFKTWAWQTRHGWLRGLVLELTSAADFLLTGLHAQNPALIRTWDAFGRGNFVFGKALMVVDHAKAEREIAQPQMRGSYFMGLPIVGFSPSTFASNAGPISVSQPARGVLRAHLDEHLLKPHHREPDLGNMRERCAEALGDWVNDSRRDHFLCLRGAVMRVLTLLLADVALEKDEAERITTAYLRRFAELSAFSYYLPAVLSLLGTHEGVRREVYVPLKAKGIDPLAIDMIMFAGMFSVGTILMKCVDHARDFDLDYGALSPRERVTFVIESLRLFPTVSTVHRLLEEPETVKLRGREITMQPGQEIAYPFVCIHRDTTVFADPEALRLDRPEHEMAAILSWSKGPHVCPARDLSILVTVMMLDALAESAGDLREVHLRNIEV